MVQELAAAAQQVVNSLMQHVLLLLSASQHNQQQHQNHHLSPAVITQLACEVQEVWDGFQQAAGASPGGQQASQPSSSSSASTSQSHSDTVQELTRLHGILLQLQHLAGRMPSQHSQQGSTSVHICPRQQQWQQQLQEQLEGLAVQAGQLLQELTSPAGSSTAGRFEWVDGSLTTAIQRGTWVLLDNANLVNPTVLDRLNGLLEPGGVLQLDEAGGASSSAAGGGRVVVPHPGFRLILAYDPKHGEVSRAMRNRGVELFLLPPQPTSPLGQALAEPGANDDQAVAAGVDDGQVGRHRAVDVVACGTGEVTQPLWPAARGWNLFSPCYRRAAKDESLHFA